MKTFELNDLPKYNGWACALLNDSRAKIEKNDEQITREFGHDKWGFLLAKWLDNPCDVERVRRWMNPPDLTHAGIIAGNLNLMADKEAHDYYLNLVEAALLGDKAKDLVEIGCGFGSVLLDLVGRRQLNYDRVIGLEYTDQGAELTKRLSDWHGHDIIVGMGDFNLPGISDLTIPQGSDILTSYAFHYVNGSAQALKNIIELKPKRVIQFEPILQHYDHQTLIGNLQAKYLDVNNYNDNFRLELKQLEELGKVEIVQEQPMVFGANCFLPASLLIWKPIE